jgi:hypothetical protein
MPYKDKAKQKEYQKEWRAKNPNANKKWRAKNPNANKKWRAKLKENIVAFKEYNRKRNGYYKYKSKDNELPQ